MSGLQTSHKDIIGDMLSVSTQPFVDESAKLTAVNGTPGAGQFRSSITGRAPIPDIANDLRASFGIERVPIQSIMLLQNEFGPNGEPVYAALNDTRGLIRFVGSGLVIFNNVNGQGVYGVPGDYVEISFYGTGLNLLTHAALALACDGAITVDGVSAGTFIESTASSSSVLASRNCSTHAVKNVVSGLALGIHTVKIVCSTNYLDVQGFEILNENASGLVNVNPGTSYSYGKKYINTLADSVAYNTGITGTKGGRIIHYVTNNDTVSQAVTLVNASVARGNSADHTNEEIARTIFVREFGAGRADLKDFSIKVDQDDMSFTLDDGTTSLAAKSCWVTGGGVSGACGELELRADPNAWVITFVGCGLDLDLRDTTSGGNDTYYYSIDGESQQAWFYTAGNAALRNQKIVSGLPYGTHTFKFWRGSAATFTPKVLSFIIYQPKKPTLPTGAIEIADYNVMATYIPNSTGGHSTIATGVLRKYNVREFIYVNTWFGGNVNYDMHCGGTDVTNSTNGAYLEYTFFGTGIELRGYSSSNRSSSVGVLIDGAVPTCTVAAYGGWSYSSPNIDCTGATNHCAGIALYGLTLGIHKVRFTNNTTGFFSPAAIDIVTPIHSYKSNLYADLQNTLPVGSQSLCDSRQTSPVPNSLSAPKAWVQAVGITSTVSTTATGYVPVPDLSVTIKTNGGPLDISFGTRYYFSTANMVLYFTVYIDGISVHPDINLGYESGAGLTKFVNSRCIVPVSSGTHKIDVMWKVNGNTGYSIETGRILTVKEL